MEKEDIIDSLQDQVKHWAMLEAKAQTTIIMQQAEIEILIQKIIQLEEALGLKNGS